MLGNAIPGRDVMVRIYAVTGGQVQPNDFFPLPDLDAPHANGETATEGAAA